MDHLDSTMQSPLLQLRRLEIMAWLRLLFQQGCWIAWEGFGLVVTLRITEFRLRVKTVTGNDQYFGMQIALASLYVVVPGKFQDRKEDSHHRRLVHSGFE